jgi:hypothetical protein
MFPKLKADENVMDISEVPDTEVGEGNQILFQINFTSMAPKSDGGDGLIVASQDKILNRYS